MLFLFCRVCVASLIPKLIVFFVLNIGSHVFYAYICRIMRNLVYITYIFIAVMLSLLFVWTVGRYYDVAEPDTSQCVDIEPVVKSDTIRLMFGGDVMQHMPQVNAARTDSGYDYRPSFKYVAPMFRDADIAVVNLETTLTWNNRYTGYPRFRSPLELADALVDMGIDIALLANNHCLDGDPIGVATTTEELDKRGIYFTGAFRDEQQRQERNVIRFECHGVRFALINYTYDTNGLMPRGDVKVNYIDEEQIKKDISTIDRNEVDCLIACMHWGAEYQRRPNEEQLALEQMLKEEGVDIIIGSHPHVVQRYKVDSTGVVFYSLGNLVSNQRKRYCNGGLLAEVEVVRCDTIDNLQFKAVAHPVFVAMPGYRIMPKHIGDTIKMSSDSRRDYNTFMSDTESLLYGKSK